ncbi:MAG: MucR family transcriptional regulator [Proteobacteria bacterium]|nr:transcriptional regulator [Desulfobulbaceae bacterium]MBU4151365.1 MucR family transcriptional regulator [Pseudomonadota bacterium]MDP2107044.1 MucR family transcriptional regulator [Desulfobulbaceae bacterium]
MGKTLVEMAADIVQAQSASKSMTQEEISSALQITYKTLMNLQINEQSAPGEELTSESTAPDITPEKSIQKNKIICLECGQEFKMLSPKHLASHGLNGREYRKKYGLKLRQPLCAKALSTARKKAGKDRGIPENLMKSIAAKKEKSAAKTKLATKKASGKKAKKEPVAVG